MGNRIAFIYANALFDIAIEKKLIADVNSQLNYLYDIFKENNEYFNILTSPIISYVEKIKVLYNVYENKLDCYILNFLSLLIKNNRLVYFFYIVNDFNKIYDNFSNKINIEVTTSVLLNNNLKNLLITKLENKLKKKVNIINIIDYSIIGGISIKIGNKVIDSTIVNKLNNIKLKLYSTK